MRQEGGAETLYNQDPGPGWESHKWKDNYNSRDSPQGVRVLSSKSGSQPAVLHQKYKCLEHLAFKARGACVQENKETEALTLKG